MNRIAIVAIAAVALAGCKKEQVIVAMPVMVPPPPAKLMEPAKAAECAKNPKTGSFKVAELEKINDCHRRDRDRVVVTLDGLQQSVRTRWMEMDHLKKKAEAEVAAKKGE